MFFRDKARPFKELNEDASEFIALFEEDINKCSEILDHMLSDLFLESRRDHASDKEFLVTFSKKKYEIFKNTSSLLNELEEKWLKQISQLKKKFVENTEIYLAGFKASTEDSSDSIKHVRRTIGINRETTPPLVTVNMSDVSSTEFPRNGRRRGTSNKIVDQSEICSTPPNVSKVRSRKGTPNRVAADRTVPNSKAEKMNVDSYIEVSTSTGKTPKKVQFAVNDDDIDSNFSEDSLVEFDARQKSMHSYLSELKKHSPEGKDYEEFTSWTFKKSSEDLDPPEKVMPKARGRRKTISSTLEENLADLNPPEKGMPKARGGRRTISRAVEESLEDFNPFEKVTPKSSSRRKTISSVFEENLEDTNTPHTSDQTSFKRKSVSSVNAAPSPKRLRSGKRNSVAAVTKVKEEPVNNSLECDSSAVEDNYTQWVLLQDLGSKISTKPGVYELKVWRAKKSAFIGSCENLHQKLELHKLGQNSGHKHLDKFLERNKNDVLVRYEEMPSFMVAKAEEKKRVESFITLHKTTPAYN